MFIRILRAHCFPEFLFVLHLSASLGGLGSIQAVWSSSFSEPRGSSEDCSLYSSWHLLPYPAEVYPVCAQISVQRPSPDPMHFWSSFSVACSPPPLVLCSTDSSSWVSPDSKLCGSDSSSRLLDPCPAHQSGKCLQTESQGRHSLGSQSCRAQCLKAVPYIFVQFLVIYIRKASPVPVTLF